MEISLENFKKNYLVVGLSDADIARVAELASLKVVQAGFELVKLGQSNPDLYVILEGTAMVYRKGGVLLGERGPGSVIGEVALVDDQPRSAYVVAKGPLTYAELNGKALRRFMFTNKDVGFIMLSNLSRVMSMRLREATETIEDLHGQVGDPWEFAD